MDAIWEQHRSLTSSSISCLAAQLTLYVSLFGSIVRTCRIAHYLTLSSSSLRLKGCQLFLAVSFQKSCVSSLEIMVPYGTVYSGMEIFSYVMDCMFKCWKRITGIQLEGSLEWCIEQDGWKQDWIQSTFNPKQLFGDIFELRADDWNGFDRIANSKQQLFQWVRAFAAGFECDSVAAYNRNATKNRNCVEANEGKTGTTAHGVFDLLHYLNGILIGFLENVKTLGQKNLLALMEKMNERGMMAITQPLDSKDYGSGGRRGRQWFLLAFVGEIDQLSKDWVEPTWAKVFTATLLAMRIGQGRMEDFLFPEGHPILEAFHEGNWIDRQLKDQKEEKAKEQQRKKEEAARAKGAVSKKRKKDASVDKWETDHDIIFKEACEKYPLQDINKYDDNFYNLLGFLPRRCQ